MKAAHEIVLEDIQQKTMAGLISKILMASRIHCPDMGLLSILSELGELDDAKRMLGSRKVVSERGRTFNKWKFRPSHMFDFTEDDLLKQLGIK